LTLTTLVLRNIRLVAKIRIEFQRLVSPDYRAANLPVSQRIATAFSNRLLKNYPQKVAELLEVPRRLFGFSDFKSLLSIAHFLVENSSGVCRCTPNLAPSSLRVFRQPANAATRD
jgi:hypothetical protein